MKTYGFMEVEWLLAELAMSEPRRTVEGTVCQLPAANLDEISVYERQIAYWVGKLGNDLAVPDFLHPEEEVAGWSAYWSEHDYTFANAA